MKYVVLPRKKPNAQQDIRGDMNKILREIADLRRMINNTNNNVSAKNDALTRRVDDILTWVRYFEKKNTDA